jgi:hypothetical protein
MHVSAKITFVGRAYSSDVTVHNSVRVQILETFDYLTNLHTRELLFKIRFQLTY